MSVIKKIILCGVAAMLATSSPLWASDVYIDQAGSTTTIDITQTGDSNRVGSSATASTIIGDNTDVDITQTGDLNTADIETATGASGTVINYTATGSSNILDVDISAATDTTLTTTIAGDSNEVTLCGTLGTVASVGVSATCATEVSASTTDTTVTIAGDSNQVAVGVDAANAVNKINIGAGGVSSYNIVNLSQTGLDSPVVTLNVDGSTNAINITQN
jgi:hypothetical protein